MNALHSILAAAGLIFVVLYLMSPRRPKWAMLYGRYAILAMAGAIILTPFAWLLCAVFKHPTALMEYTFLPPPGTWKETLSVVNFVELFKVDNTPEGDVRFWIYILNSVFLASTQTVLQLFFCSLGGYALAKFDFRGKAAVMAFMLGSMMIPPILFLAPVYELIVKIHLVDTYWALLLPGAVSVFGMFLFRQAIIGVPNDLIEAGRIDGCSEFGIYLRLVMPLVRPMSGAFCLVIFLGSWNNFLSPQIFLHSQSKLTLPVILNQFVGLYQQEYGVFLAGTVLAIIPPAILFFALQKEFISGLTSGAVKG